DPLSLATTRARPTAHAFFFNDPAPPDIYTLSLHDALPIYGQRPRHRRRLVRARRLWRLPHRRGGDPRTDRSRLGQALPRLFGRRSEEHTSELQSRENLVCRLLLEKKNKQQNTLTPHAPRPA